MPDPPKRQPYPTKKELILLTRDVLDQKPQAIELIKSVAHQFQLPTLEAANNMARAYLDNLADDGSHPG